MVGLKTSKSEENLIKNLSRISLFLLSRIGELEKYLYWGLIRGGLICIGRSGDLKILEKSDIKSFKNLSRIGEIRRRPTSARSNWRIIQPTVDLDFSLNPPIYNTNQKSLAWSYLDKSKYCELLIQELDQHESEA